MKFTSIKTNKQQQMQVGVHEAAWFMERITHETNECLISGFREFLKSPSHWGGYPHIGKIPRLCVGGEFCRTKMGDLAMKTFNGLIVTPLVEPRSITIRTDIIEKLLQCWST